MTALSACMTAPIAPLTCLVASLRLYAAGSLKVTLTDIANGQEAPTGTPVALTFGASS